MVDQANINVSPLELAYVQSPYDYAEIVSIDTSEAIKVPGVVSVITADDIPGDNNTLGMQGACELLAEKFVNYLKKKFSPYCSVATWYLWRSIDDEPIQY